MSDLNNIQPTDEASDDTPVEGTTLDGAALDGTTVDGTTLDGTTLNGAALTGAALDGAALNEGPAAADQSSGPGKSGKDSKPKAANLHELVDEPAKVMRIGTMIRQLLEEVKAAPLDDAARGRLAEIHERSIKELEDGLAPELIEELERISLPLPEDKAPSDAELRIAQAQLVGWLEGLFHGIQAAIAAQQAAKEHAAAQLQLRQLPPGTVIAPGIVIGENGQPQRAAAPGAPGAPQQGRTEDPDHGPGQYL